MTTREILVKDMRGVLNGLCDIEDPEKRDSLDLRLMVRGAYEVLYHLLNKEINGIDADKRDWKDKLYLARCVSEFAWDSEGLPFEEDDSILRLRRQRVCTESRMGEHKCSVKTSFGEDFCCDVCLEPEIKELWMHGIKTVGSCCGHSRMGGYIQVKGTDKDIAMMKELGYKELPVDWYGNGKNCYVPKTRLL